MAPLPSSIRLARRSNSTHRRRFHETALPLHTMLYVMGQARERQDVVAAEIAKDKNGPDVPDLDAAGKTY
ncbi:MAG: hypothetical protein Q7R50_04695 [Dehalococcoidales bacterium]|nr:hypothetical protein [Dehalococcoidales bacterium]